MFSVVFSALVIGCGVVEDESPDSRQIQYRQGLLTIPGAKSPDWPAAVRPTTAGAGRARNVVLISPDTLRRDYVSAFGEVPDLPVAPATRVS